MSRDFRRTDRETPWLLPPSLQDWLPEGHLARFVVDIVEQLDLSELTSDYSRGGKRAYHPAMLLSLLFYGYATGIFSSRKLERATYESVAFRFVAANLHPDHDTIAAFRKRFIGHLGGLFIQILMMARTLGVLQLGNVSLDGTKIKANASKHKVRSGKYVRFPSQQLYAPGQSHFLFVGSVCALEGVERSISGFRLASLGLMGVCSRALNGVAGAPPQGWKGLGSDLRNQHHSRCTQL